MKIGIVGGTFNPIHVGHLMLGEYAYEELSLDEIWFMPNGNPPHKDSSVFSSSTEARIKMIELAIADIKHFSLCEHEIMKESVSYSYRTMEELKSIYLKHEFYFIIGSDSLLAIETWMHPDLLLKSCTILVACRETIDMNMINTHIRSLEQKYACNITLLKMPILEVSSSNIRERLNDGKSIKYIVPDIVHQYIEEHHLYRNRG